MKVKRIAECSPWSILQYFWPALSNNWFWKPIFGLFEGGHFRQVLLYLVNTVKVWCIQISNCCFKLKCILKTIQALLSIFQNKYFVAYISQNRGKTLVYQMYDVVRKFYIMVTQGIYENVCVYMYMCCCYLAPVQAYAELNIGAITFW